MTMPSHGGSPGQYPYGQYPGYGQPGGVGPGGPGQPPMSPVGQPQGSRKRSTLAKVGIALGVVGVLVAGGLATLLIVGISVGHTPDVGECVHITKDDPTSGEFDTVDCGDEQALYRVASTVDGGAACPEGDYAPFELREEEDGNVATTLCMVLNVDDGDCLASMSDRTQASKTPCRNAAAEVEVDVHDGVAERGRCQPGDESGVYPQQPARTVCLRPAANTNI